MPGTPLFKKSSHFAENDETLDENYDEQKYWTILVADDEKHVHELTQLLLEEFRFENIPLNILNAYTGEEAKEFLRTRDDIALALLDVVMETDDAGLDVARYAREELNNRYTRIVLRTGQPGHAPEARVIRDFDIDDYKDKTELTDIKLYTLIYSSLRSYRDICTLDQSRRGLGRIISSSLEIFQSDSMFKFASSMLSQITNILNLNRSAIYCTSVRDEEGFKVLAATGEMTALLGTDEIKNVPDSVRTGFDLALKEKKSIHQKDCFIGYYKTNHGNEGLLYIAYENTLSTLDKQLLEIFSANVAIGYENLLMHDEVMNTQKEVVYMLGEAVEQRSKETGAHVKRIAYICKFFALKYGLDEMKSELIKLASPLHDVGKVGIPDAILNKAGKHTDVEWEVMKSHASMGQEMLGKSDKKILKLSAIIAGQHHEKWDGTGYPLGLKGMEIDVSARICAIADVFDALGSDRCYKKAWELDAIVAFIQSQSGLHFEPKLVEIFNENINELKLIRENFPDD